MRRRGFCLAFGLALSGCGYSLRPPYDPNVRTVYVPVFRSITFRRDVHLLRPEHLKKEIARRTRFLVVGTPYGADSTLDGTINFSDKNIVVANPFNLPRQLTTLMVATVTWTDNTVNPEELKNTNPAVVSEMFTFHPEVGETVQAAWSKTCERLAIQIVNMMEEPW